MPTKKNNTNYSQRLEKLFYLSCVILILLLSFFNLYSLRKNEIRVLGAQEIDNSEYWSQVSQKYPTYIPAWLEQGRVDKVKEIDPNYFLER